MKRLLILALLLTVGAGWSGTGHPTAAAAPPAIAAAGAAALTDFLRTATSRGDVPGVVVAVVGRNGVLYHEAFGTMNAARQVPMARDAIFNIASMTKPVTSAAIMMLVDERRLSLDDDVSKYLPKYAKPLVITTFNQADASYETGPARRPITIRHLLTHTSGIGYGFSSSVVTALQRKTMQNELDLPLLFNPGESWAYGASTRVLGHVVEAISGQKLDAFLDSRILRPLGMSDTGYAVPAEKHARVVTTHQRTDSALVERPVAATLPANVTGDGGLYSTAGDYARFVQMLLDGGRIGSTRILNERTVRTMFQSHTGSVVVQPQATTNPSLSKPFPRGAGEDTWGLGFQLSNPKTRTPGTRSPGSGTWAGIFNTHFWVDPKAEIGVVVMMQLLPFYDDQAMNVLSGVEQRVYGNLK